MAKNKFNDWALATWWKCPHCGRKQVEMTTYCPDCGVQLIGEREEEDEEE